MATTPRVILRTGLKHGWWYHYRLHEEKTARLCDPGFASLAAYLRAMTTSCPDEKFLFGPRSSALRFPVGFEARHAPGHEVCAYARLAQANGRGRSPHTEVQCLMLAQDAKSIATEVPLWLDEEEHALMRRFAEPGPLSGHIDVLRVENEKIAIWDYKPKAAKEKHAATQVYAYAVMLSRRTGIPLDAFRCGWFDETDAYLFAPTR